MRLVLDQGVPRDAAGILRGLGHDCEHAGEIGMSKATDEEILAFSLKTRAVVVTLDADFHAIPAVARAAGPSVIRLRLQGLGAPEVVEVVQKVLMVFEQDLRSGCLIAHTKLLVIGFRLAVPNSRWPKSLPSRAASSLLTTGWSSPGTPREA